VSAARALAGVAAAAVDGRADTDTVVGASSSSGVLLGNPLLTYSQLRSLGSSKELAVVILRVARSRHVIGGLNAEGRGNVAVARAAAAAAAGVVRCRATCVGGSPRGFCWAPHVGTRLDSRELVAWYRSQFWHTRGVNRL